MTNRTNLLLWTDNPAPYIDSLTKAGLAEQVAIDALGRRDTPSDAQVTQTNVLLTPIVPPGLLPRMQNLRWAQAMTAGVEAWFALPDLPQDLTLTCARGTHRESMPENIMAALFHVAKPLAPMAEDQKQAIWRQQVLQPLNGKTLGILGLGEIGAQLARIAAALNMTVIGTKRRPAPVPHVTEVLPGERTNEVLSRSDYVVLLLPATPDTENFIDAHRLSQMKPSAWLLNFGRGATIKDDDLINAVSAGTIAGAVLDVFRQEPLPKDHPFWTAKGILVLPHVGGPHPDRDTIVARLFTDNLRRFLAGEKLTQVVDRHAGY